MPNTFPLQYLEDSCPRDHGREDRCLRWTLLWTDWKNPAEPGLDGLYDYSSLFEDLDLFLDTDHCNEDGAKILIRNLERDAGLRLAR